MTTYILNGNRNIVPCKINFFFPTKDVNFWIFLKYLLFIQILSFLNQKNNITDRLQWAKRTQFYIQWGIIFR